MKTPVKIKLLKEGISVPEYQTSGAAAVDLRAALDEPFCLKAGGTALIPTGISIECEPGITALVFPRSGLAIKHGISLSNCVGVIDSDYRGEVKVGLKNDGTSDFVINNGDRIAQMGFFPVFTADFIVEDELSDTERGSGGFGHTGI